MCKGDRLSSNANRYENSRLKSLRVESCKLCTELNYANMSCRLQNPTHEIPMTKKGEVLDIVTSSNMNNAVVSALSQEVDALLGRWITICYKIAILVH